jgi:hypothetical protein
MAMLRHRIQPNLIFAPIFPEQGGSKSRLKTPLNSPAEHPPI